MTAHPDDRGTETRRGPLLATALSGLLYAALVFVPQVDGPDVETATAVQIRSFVAEHDTGLRLVTAAAALSIPLVLVFTTALARMIRDRAPGSLLADLVVGGGILVAVWHWLVAAGNASTLVQTLDGYDLAKVSDPTLVGWYGFSNVTHLFADLGMCGIATVMGTASLAALRFALLPRWAAWAGIVFSTGGIVGTVGITLAWVPLADVWFLGIFGWFLWVVAVAVACGLRARRQPARAAASPASAPAS